MGDNTLALAMPTLTAADVPTATGSGSLQLAFKVADQVFGHRTLFFRDPDGNLLEVFADIELRRHRVEKGEQ